MSDDPIVVIAEALEVLALPKLICKEDIKKQYRFLARRYHPDLGGDVAKMEQINHAYGVLMQYIEEFRYTFDEDEIRRQFPGVGHAQRFRP